MALILASGQAKDRLAESTLPASEGFGPVWRLTDGQHWLLVGDANAEPGQAEENQLGWRVGLYGYLANSAAVARLLNHPPDQPQANQADLVACLLNEQGPDGLHALTGNFVVLAGDTQSGQVLAFRDRLGGRTLYFSENQSGLLLATRAGWVARMDNKPFELDPIFISGHFSSQPAPPPGLTPFSGITELMPGECLVLADEKLTRTRRELNLTSEFDYRDPADCIARFGELFEQSVAATLPAEGNVACMLSGGLDSGPMAILADRLLAEKSRRLVVTSWQLPAYPEADEGEWISQVMGELRQPAELFDGSPMRPFDRLDELMICAELPFYNAFRPLVLNCYRLAAEADCRVVLNGNAGDELYAPRRLLNLDRLRRRHFKPLWRDLVSIWRAAGLRSVLADAAFRHPIGRLIPRRRRPRPPHWLTEHGRKHWQAPEIWPEECADAAWPEYAWQLVGSRMAYGRAHENPFPNQFGVDRRDPFHNEALVRFMLNAPMSLSHKGGADKWIMRMAMRGILPNPVRKKARTGLLHSFFEAGLTANRPALRQLLFEQQTGWQRYVKPDIVAAVLDGKDAAPVILLASCVGHALWERRWQR